MSHRVQKSSIVKDMNLSGVSSSHRKTNTVDPIVKTSSLGNIEVVEERQAPIFPFIGTIMASKVASVKKSKQHVTKEEKARRHRKAQAEYRARNPHLREKERIKAAERNLALKANRRRWDPPKVPKVATTQSSRPESVQHGLVGSIEDKTHSFRDPRARSDLSFAGKPRGDSEEPAAGTSDSPTPEERLACSALAQLAQGVTLADLDEDSRIGVGDAVSFTDFGVRDKEARVTDVAGSLDSVLERAMQLSSISSSPLYFPPEFALGDGPISSAAKTGKLPPGVTPLSRIQNLKLYYTGDPALTPVQTAQVWVAEINTGGSTAPTAAEILEWAAPAASSWDWLTYSQGCSITAWRLAVCKAARAVRREGGIPHLGMNESEIWK
ncbi:hypothetical protein C8R47DRAFT_1082900 [Mycena vitilis]|nr:hypothetical protein C8R47DRAFT_1082900 [Mycena vitilis]